MATERQDDTRLDPVPVDDALSTLYLLSDTINRIRTARPDGTLDLKVANSVGFLAGKLLESRKQLLFEEGLIKDSICKDKKIDTATFRKLMHEYEAEFSENTRAFILGAQQRYDEHKKHKDGAYLF